MKPERVQEELERPADDNDSKNSSESPLPEPASQEAPDEEKAPEKDD